MSTAKDHILSKYPVPRNIKKGMPVVAFGKRGVITGYVDAYVRVRFEGNIQSSRVHPLDIAYDGESQDAVDARRDQMQARIDSFNRAINRSKPKDWRTLPAGRELDVVIARALGWTQTDEYFREDGEDVLYHGIWFSPLPAVNSFHPDTYFDYPFPLYSEDRIAAKLLIGGVKIPNIDELSALDICRAWLEIRENTISDEVNYELSL